jgi:hypothetical protein
MKQTITLLFILTLPSILRAQPSTGGNTTTGGMQQMYVDQISYGKNDKVKEIGDAPLIYYSNSMILIPFYKYNPTTHDVDVTYDTIDISGISTGSSTFTAIINKCRNSPPPKPEIDCDSLKKLCKGTLSLFWGNIFSTLNNFGEQKVSGESMKELKEDNKSASLLVSNGWIWNCKEQKWRLQLFVQVMKQKGKKESAVWFYDDSNVDPCESKAELDAKKRNRKK